MGERDEGGEKGKVWVMRAERERKRGKRKGGDREEVAERASGAGEEGREKSVEKEKKCDGGGR